LTSPPQARKRSGFDSPRTYAWPPLPPHEFEVISVTSALDAGVSKPFLIGWAAKVTAQKAIDDHDIIGAMLAKGDERGAIEYVKRARFGDSGTKADRGTIVHSALESYLAGRTVEQEAIEAQLKEARVPLNMWKSTSSMVAALMEFLADEEPEVYWSESTVYSRQHGYAGTADLIGKMRVGGTVKPVVIDVKTSKAIYDETAAQLVAYARADFVGLDDGTETPLTPDGEPIEHGVVVRPKADGTYEKVVFTLTDGVYAFFLGALRVAQNKAALAASRRPA